MSIQAQPQQPVQVYPTSVTNQPSSHHSNGSFGTVFIVLAIILIISVVACFLGRLCNRRYNNNRNHDHHSMQRPVKPPQHRQQQIHDHDFHPREGDIEFGGVDKRMPPPIIGRPKIPFHGPAGTGSQQHAHNNGNMMKDFEMKSDHEGELRAGS